MIMVVEPQRQMITTTRWLRPWSSHCRPLRSGANDTARRSLRSRGPQPTPARRTYEERITIWQASSLDEAIELAIAEAHEFAAVAERYVGLAQAYEMGDEPLEPGAEVFSSIRASRLEPANI